MAPERDQAQTRACPAYEGDLVLLHYGDLGGDERQKLESHITSCSGCKGYLEELAALLPLTVKIDEPSQEFWQNYNRELRGKLDDMAETRASWRNLTALLRPRYAFALASAAVVVLALTLTLGKGVWHSETAPRDEELADVVPVAENLDFFRAMDILDNLELLEFMNNQANSAA